MRASVVLSGLVVGALVVLPAIYFRDKSGELVPAVEKGASTPEAQVSAKSLPPLLQRVVRPVHVQDNVPVIPEAAADLQASNHQEYVTKRGVELYEMGMSQNPGSLAAILTEVHNPDPEIRKAALTATMDLGSTNAIPALKNEMTWTEDPAEKLEIQKAIKFLELPPFALDENGAIVQQTANGASGPN